MIELYPHQLEAIEKLHNGSILCAGVGTGKSLTALGYFVKKECNGTPNKDLYIITTAFKKKNLEWEYECNKFLLSSLGGQEFYNVKVVIDSWNCIKKYEDVKDAFFIFDEQRVVGWGAWSKSFVKISKSNRWILLTATPGDKVEDYIPVMIANGFYRNRSEFIRRHIIYLPFRNFPVVDRYVNMEEFSANRDRILVHMCCKKMTDIHDETIFCDFDKEKYLKVLKDRWNIYENKPVENVSELCSLLRRVSNEHVSRSEAIKYILSKNDKVIIFYNFDYELDILKNLLESLGVAYSQWNGHKHEKIKNDEDKWAYLVNYMAGAEGWNCIETNVIIFYSQSYSYKTMIQAAGRIDRLNTPFKDLYYYYLKSLSTIDKSISRCLELKEDFNEKAFISLWED